MACEGALLARDVSQGETTVFFAREQAFIIHDDQTPAVV